MTALEHKQEMDNIKLWLYSGAITYEQAQEMAKPHLEAMNAKSRELAKKFGVKPKLISFTSFMR